MNTQESTPRAAGAAASPNKKALLFGILIIAVAVAVFMFLPPRWRPQLNVTNTGTKPVTLSYRDHTSVTEPGKTWSMRFSAGDTVTIRAGEGANAGTRIIELPKRNPKPWAINPTAQRWRADVNADDPKNIRFENRSFEEISSPPRPSEPWPE